MDAWTEIKALVGKTLRTLDQNNAFDVIAVTDQAVVVCPRASGKERTIKRGEIEPAFRELVARGMIQRTDVRDRYSNFNPAYVAAILAALPGVRHSVRPIRLYYDRSAER
jgi:hypothetical protein